MWRIARINEDGSIKIITNDNITNNIVYDNTKPNTPDFKNSNIENIITDWYNSNIIDTGKIVNTIFCNDISSNYLNARERILNNNPTFVCPSNEFEINSKFGLLTADELIFAGGSWQYSSNIYLKDWFWVMTPYNESSAFQWRNNLIGENWASTDIAATKIVVSLDKNVIYNEGNGTESNPYTIK